jgi:hypothetical protein
MDLVRRDVRGRLRSLVDERLKRQSINGHFGTLCSGIKMQITPWFIDAGNPTRILRAVD